MESPETVGVQVHEKMRGQEAQTKPRRHLIRTPGHEPSSATTRDVMTSEDVRLEVHNKRPRCHCFICEDLHGDNWYSGSQSADGGWIMSNIRTKVHSIRKSADQGCDVSKCLLQALEMLGDNVHKVDLGYRENQGILYIMSAGSDPYTATGLTEDLLWERDRVNIYPPSMPPYFWHGKSKANIRHPPGKADSNASFEFIRSSLDECVAHHNLCRRPDQFTPKRLLHIGPDGKSLKLLTYTGANHLQYAALSHCWGKSRPLSSTEPTLASREAGIEWSCLPKTFQDAAIMAFRLGMEYLWIDALCILQDSASDWAEESSKMAQVYRNAHITIAGGCSADCQESFLHKTWEPHMVVESKTADGHPASLHIQKQLRSGIHYNEENHSFGGHGPQHQKTKGQVDPLDMRGWTLQERDLATRRLVFSSGEVQWVCNTVTRCECSPEIRHLLEKKSVEWTTVVSELNQRNFTHENDKLPALSGIASELFHITRSKYLGGLWMNDLQAQLMWAPIYGKYQPLPQSYIAPSFSWASINCKFAWPYLLDIKSGGLLNTKSVKYLTLVVGGLCNPSTSDTFGRIDEGFIKLFGTLKNGYVRLEEGYKGYKFASADGAFRMDGYVPDDDGIFEYTQFYEDSALKPVRILPNEGFTVSRSSTPVVTAFGWAPVKFLLMCQRDKYYDALVLGRSQAKVDCYVRLGVALHMELNSRLFGDGKWIEEGKEIVTIV